MGMMNMANKFLLITFALLGCSRWILREAVASPKPEYQLNDTTAKVTDDPSTNLDVEEEPSPSDSHEAMNNRGYKPERRTKRSFEFLMGLINNNSKFEVIRSDPDLSGKKILPENLENHTVNADATKLLLDLLAKIVTYPERWRQIHQILRNLDQDLTSSQHILHHHQQTTGIPGSNSNKRLEGKRTTVRQNKSGESTTMKWPNFDNTDEENMRTTRKNEDKTAYQKNFAYHKVTGKPPHLKKNPTAYIAVSALSPKPSGPEEEFLLETELHQLKPWKNKRSRV